MGSNKLNVLILEDEGLIAMHLATFFGRHGYTIVGPAGTCPDALDLLQAQNVDVGILDLLIGDETCGTVADALNDRDIPWLITTGFDVRSLPKRYQNVPLFAKPVLNNVLLDEVEKLIGRQSA